MDLSTRFEKFEAAHQKAVANINQFLTDTDGDVRTLVNWLMRTDANPWGFLPAEWAGAVSDAVGFSSLCHHVHHALVDDGTINFVSTEATVEVAEEVPRSYSYYLEPRISFFDRWIEGYEDRVLSEQELANKTVAANRTVSYKIGFIESVEDFIRLHQEYHTDRVKRNFLARARHDRANAIED